jgi:hypothetical protein
MKSLCSILSLVCFLVACKKDTIKTEEILIFGKWNLIRYEGGCFAPIYDYTIGDIVWNIEDSTSIQVSISPETSDLIGVPLNDNGTYGIDMDSSTIILENTGYNYIVDSLNLKIHGDVASGGKLMYFVRDIQ